MARDEEDDLFEDDIDFVDDDDFSDEEAEGDDDSDVEGDEEEAPPAKPRKKVAKKAAAKPRETKKKAARPPRAKKAAEPDAAPAEEPAPAKKSSEIPKRAWDLADETPAPPRSRRGAPREEVASEPADDFVAPTAEAPEPAEQTDEFGRPAPLANYVVHVYEHQRLKRTIDRDFTPEDAELFAAEYSRTGKSYGRTALAGKKDTEPKKRVDAVNKADSGPTVG